MPAFRIVEESVHWHFKVDLPDGTGIWWVTYNRRLYTNGPVEDWRCTCQQAGCEHIAALRTHLTAPPQERAA